MSRLYRIRQYPGKGRGIEAKTNIPAGTRLAVTPALVLPKEQYASISATELSRYVFAWGDQPESSDEAVVAVALGVASFFNHSQKANCAYWPDLKKTCIVVETNRDVVAGEELCIDYGWTEPGFKEGLMTEKSALCGALVQAMLAVTASKKPDDDAAKDLKLRVLRDSKSQKLVQNVFKEFVGESDFSQYLAFMKKFDDLLFEFRGKKPLSKQEVEELEREFGDRDGDTEEEEGEGEGEKKPKGDEKPKAKRVKKPDSEADKAKENEK